MIKTIENYNRLFGFFLKEKGVENPKFKKTKFGYQTYGSKDIWRLFKKTNSITLCKPCRTYNGYDYDNSLEESKFIIKLEETIKIAFLYTKII